MLVICTILAYLIGSVSSSTIIGKLFGHLDIREYGSGNAGATNTLRVLGLKWALVVLIIDIAKGMAAVGLAVAIGHGSFLYVSLAGLAVIVGHNWPIYFGFRGGKGIATTIGVLALVMFVPALFAGIIAIFLVATTRFVSLGALTFTILTPVFAATLGAHLGPVLFAIVIALLSIYRHRGNIVRLVKGQERRIFTKSL